MTAPRSTQFDDIYFSPEDGLAETQHVFIAGNNLPAVWRGRASFTIAETGFGTGLNFLAAWTAFDRMAQPGQKLHYVSFEKYPLSWDEISGALSPWRNEFGGRLDRLRGLYPLRVPGFHRIQVSEQVILTLIFDDVNDALPQLDAPGGVDAWFLDGFAPSKNPDMWTEALFSGMARLSSPGATFATFTVAGAVRRGLEAAGFSAEKKKGFGKKKEMLGGVFQGRGVAAEPAAGAVKKVAVLGGGLAGTATAFALRRSGLVPVIFEKNDSLAFAGSGNEVGLFNPRLSAQRSAESDFYTAAFAQAVRTLAELQGGHDINLNPCGSLHLLTDEAREKRLRGAYENWGWHRSHMHLMDAETAARRAGIPLSRGALCLPDAGTVKPSALCHAYANGIETRLGETPDVEKLIGVYDAVVIASGAGGKDMPALAGIPLHTVRGQVTHFTATQDTFELKTNLCFGGYLSPHRAGGHTLGATFQRWREDCDVTDEDHEQNMRRLHEILPSVKAPQISGGRAALRVSAKDRFPVIGHVSGNIYASIAHGSHGIISSIAGAHLLADMMTGTPRSLPWRAVETLAPARFAEREARSRRG